MAKANLRRNTIVKENRRLMRNLKRRFQTIEKRYGQSFATYKFRELKLNFSVKGLTEEQLEQQQKDLKYISSLKSSYYKGVGSYNQFNDILNRLPGEDAKQKFFELYDKLVNEKEILYKYKYNVFEEISTLLNENETDENIRNRILELSEEWEIEDSRPTDTSTYIRF